MIDLALQFEDIIYYLLISNCNLQNVNHNSQNETFCLEMGLFVSNETFCLKMSLFVSNDKNCLKSRLFLSKRLFFKLQTSPNSLFLEWFFNHPALRYGGYSVIALLVFIPFSNYLCKFELNVNIIKKRVIFLIVISFSVYITKNIQRIIFENEKYDYNPIENPFFYINKDGFDFNNILQDIKDKNYINSNYIYINKKIIKNLN